MEQTLQEFLSEYNPGKYERPSVTVDIALLTYSNEVLLIKRGGHPNKGMWALPGGFMDMGETLYEAAQRELFEETNISQIELSPLGFFAEPSRDPRTRILTAGFLARANVDELCISAGDDAADAKLFCIEVDKKGRISIPNKSDNFPYISLPCTACGQPYSESGELYEMHLYCGEIELSARLALTDEGVEVLLGGTLRDSHGCIAADHALILFKAWRTANA